jgi:transcriptional regulator GlxA family with amidase domain
MQTQPISTLHIGITLYNGVDEAELGVILGILGKKVRQLEPAEKWEERPLEVFTFARTRASILGLGGLVMTPHYGVASVPAPKVIIALGGKDSAKAGRDPLLKPYLQAHRQVVLCGVGLGAVLLGEAGLLGGHRVAATATLEPELWNYHPLEVQVAPLCHTPKGIFAATGQAALLAETLLEQLFPPFPDHALSQSREI